MHMREVIIPASGGIEYVLSMSRESGLHEFTLFGAPEWPDDERDNSSTTWTTVIGWNGRLTFYFSLNLVWGRELRQR